MDYIENLTNFKINFDSMNSDESMKNKLLKEKFFSILNAENDNKAFLSKYQELLDLDGQT
jgi:hypothetical protein